MLKNDML